MSDLAIFGGRPVFEQPLEFSSFWPPTDERTLERLGELYLSRRWSAFQEAVPAFAQEFASYQGAKHGVFTLNGTVTLQTALAACGVGPGDEVIVAPLTWYATAIAVRHVGATPVFVDIKPDTLCIDPDKISAAVTERTRAIIPVHAYGSMADMDRIVQIARTHGLRVIEDCAHMHGGIWDGKGVGSIGDVGSFSFQQTKTMSSGEGGICITNDDQIAERMYRITHIGYAPGELPRHAKTAPEIGLLCYNFRATAFHPVILGEQLRALDDRLARYRQSVRYLQERLSSTTKIRFQAPGAKATRQGYFGWMLIFDDDAYADIPARVIQEAIAAEGLPFIAAEGPIYKFILFNLPHEEFRVDRPCLVTEHTCARSLWLLHAYLGLDDGVVTKIGDAIEKVLTRADELRSVNLGDERRTPAWAIPFAARTDG